MSQLASLEPKPAGIRYLVADEPLDSERITDASVISYIFDTEPQNHQETAPRAEGETYDQVLTQEGLADSKVKERIGTYATQDYIDHLDNLMNDMMAPGSRGTRLTDQECLRDRSIPDFCHHGNPGGLAEDQARTLDSPLEAHHC